MCPLKENTIKLQGTIYKANTAIKILSSRLKAELNSPLNAFYKLLAAAPKALINLRLPLRSLKAMRR